MNREKLIFTDNDSILLSFFEPILQSNPILTNLNPHSNHPNPSRPSGAGQDPPQSQEEAAEEGEGGIDVAGHILCQQER